MEGDKSGKMQTWEADVGPANRSTSCTSPGYEVLLGGPPWGPGPGASPTVQGRPQDSKRARTSPAAQVWSPRTTGLR